MQKTCNDKPYPGGSTIGTASTAALRSNGGSTDYSASKAGVISIMQTACYQLAGANVRCNALLSGMTETRMTAAVFYEPARQRGTEGKIGQLCPMRRGDLLMRLQDLFSSWEAMKQAM
jgi:NAD(P)-dependent dehydrogenase (short-subunit alcohol dehydrogenase family)